MLYKYMFTGCRPIVQVTRIHCWSSGWIWQKEGKTCHQCTLYEKLCRNVVSNEDGMKDIWRKYKQLQTTQPTSGGAVTVDTNFGANCVETSAPNNGGPIYCFWATRPCEPNGWLALLLIKAGDVETNPGPTRSHKRVWICDICYTQYMIGNRYP